MGRPSRHPDDALIAPRVLSRYRQMGVMPGWNSARLVKLAHLVNRTTEELGVMAGLLPHETRTCMRRDLFSPPVSLHFCMIESAIKAVRFGEPSEPAMPLNLLEENQPKKEKTMHYRNGREAKNGDKIVKLGGMNGGEVVSFGVLHSATPGNDYCNGNIAPITNDTGACMCDCLHIDDLAAILAEKGLDKRPAGK